MRLYFKDIEMGEIIDVFADMPWMYGTIFLNNNSKPFQKYFRQMVADDSALDFESIDVEFLDSENWCIFDENVEKYVEIDIPAIHIEDTTIAWRWR